MKCLIAIAVLMAGACSSAGSAEASACDAAFAAAVNPIGGGNGVEALDQAIRECDTVANWTSAWSKYPNSHGSAVDPLVFLGGRCLNDDLASVQLCVSVQQ
jgi:hypothetical protein